MSELRVATWNVLHGRSLRHGQVRVADLQAGAERLDADVVSLQEADRLTERCGGVDQPAVVARAMSASDLRFVPSMWDSQDGVGIPMQPTDAHDPRRPAYGIALLSRLPVLEWDAIRFPPAPIGMPLLVVGHGVRQVPDEPRNALAAVLQGPSGPFTVIATHLSFVPGVNARQLRQIARWAQAKPAPRLLLGDLNLPGRLPARISGWTQLARTATYPSWHPQVQFDHALADGLGPGQVRTAQALRLPVSDHAALSLTLSV